jgi:hypothetical protein
VDSKRQWRHARNVWHNSMVRSVLQTLTFRQGSASSVGDDPPAPPGTASKDPAQGVTEEPCGQTWTR